MAGKTGCDKIMKYHTFVMKVDTALNVLYIRGSLPGCPGSVVMVRDSFKSPANRHLRLPTPTLIPPADGSPVPRCMTASLPNKLPSPPAPPKTK